MPTLLTWPGSAIVHDIKGENWSLTQRAGRVMRSNSAARSFARCQGRSQAAWLVERQAELLPMPYLAGIP